MIPLLDLIALAWFAIGWIGYARYADMQYSKRVNLMSTMDMMRLRWMQEMVRRENRMVDATLIGNLLRSISFFASTTILILLGLMTVLGAQNEGISLINALPYAAVNTPLMWEIKIMLMAVIFVYAFFKLTWSLRQYNYVCALVGAVPMPDEKNHELEEYARRCARLISNAARHFNMGIRAYYYGLAAVSWFVNAPLFIVLTTLTVFVVYRREFRSHTVNHIAGLEKV